MQRKLNFILVALLCVIHTSDAAASYNWKLPFFNSVNRQGESIQPALQETDTSRQTLISKQSSRLTDVLIACNNYTSTTFNVRMYTSSTGWVFYSALPGSTNIGPVPEGTYTVAIDPNNGGSSQYNFSGFCSYTGSGYTVYWTNIAITASGSCNQINFSYK